MKKWFAFSHRLRLFSAFLCAGLLLLPGCGKSGGGGNGIVTGKVTFKGKPLPGGVIAFTPVEGKGVFRGKIEKDGTYRVEKMSAGDMKVSIQPSAPPKFAAGQVPPAEAQKMGTKTDSVDPSAYPKISKKYTDPERSGLTCTVKSGSQEYNVDLK